MVQSMNAFVQSPEKGDKCLPTLADNVVTCQVDATIGSGVIKTGQAVKLVDSAGGVPKVLPVANVAEDVFGFVVRNLKLEEYKAGDKLEIAIEGTALYMEAGAAIARGAQVQVQVSGEKVVTHTSTNPIAGYAFDKALADGDLIRVIIKAPTFAA